jgi:hypothetical protein
VLKVMAATCDTFLKLMLRDGLNRFLSFVKYFTVFLRIVIVRAVLG